MTAPVYSHSFSIRFQDVDAAGILFFARIFDYFSDTYLALLASRNVDVPRMIAEREFAIPLAHAEADYKRPLLFGTPVVVDILSSELGQSSFRLRYQVRDPSDAKGVYAIGETVHVVVDLSTFRPVAQLPLSIRGALGGSR